MLRASASCSIANTAMPCESCHKTQKDISNIWEKIKHLADELKQKDRLLAEFMDTMATQSQIISILNSPAAAADTILWDTSSSHHRPSSTSTPSSQTFWSEVVCRGRRRTSRTVSPPPLNLTNRFFVLASNVTVHPDDVPMVGADACPLSAELLAGVPPSLPLAVAPALVDTSGASVTVSWVTLAAAASETVADANTADANTTEASTAEARLFLSCCKNPRFTQTHRCYCRPSPVCPHDLCALWR